MSPNEGEQLFAAGRFRAAADWLDERAKDGLRQSDRLLLARVLLELGDSASSLKIALELLSRPLDWESTARCQSIAGRAQGRLGNHAQGLALIRKAVALAEAHDCSVEAELLSHYISAALSWVGVEPGLTELPKLRIAALKGGNRPALIDYHLCHARLAALRGRWADADRELRIASEMTGPEPDVALELRLNQVRASIAISFGDLPAARASGQRCMELAEQSGSKSQMASTVANVAHISCVAGDFRRARQLLSRSHLMLEPLSQIRFATSSTGINCGLATRDNAFAEAMASAGEDLTHYYDEQTYYQLWFVLHHVRWLIRQERHGEANTSAESALVFIDRLADSELGDRMRLLAAEAAFRSGSADSAIRLLRQVQARESEPSVETLAEIARVSALIFGVVDGELASFELSLAWRLLTSSGLRGPRAFVADTAQELGHSPDLFKRVFRVHTPGLTLSFVASLIRLAGHPRLFDSEMLAFLRSLDVCASGSLIHRRSGIENVVETFVERSRPVTKKLKTREFIIRSSVGGDVELIRVIPRDESRLEHILSCLQRFVRCVVPPLTPERLSVSSPAELSPAAEYEFGILATSGGMLDLISTTRKLAASGIPVLLMGETGTGKELLARALHDASPRAAKPWIPFNCSAVSRDMLDAQLFGYKRGAFTGAMDAFPGVIRAAAGGTLFLDEIGEISLDVQPKLLRFLESGDIHPLGEPRPIHVDVRIVAATNADLEKLVAEGRFREDLFYRLNVVRLEVPPLRDRREEVPPLAQHFLDRSCRETQKHSVRIADETMEYLILYRWPGNVRQLSNEVRRMVALAESGAVLMPEHLSHEIASSRRTLSATERTLGPTEFVVRMDQPMSAAMAHVERSMIHYALRLSGGRMEDASRRLGLSRKGLYLKRHRLGISEASATPGGSRPPAEVSAN